MNPETTSKPEGEPINGSNIYEFIDRCATLLQHIGDRQDADIAFDDLEEKINKVNVWLQSQFGTYDAQMQEAAERFHRTKQEFEYLRDIKFKNDIVGARAYHERLEASLRKTVRIPADVSAETWLDGLPKGTRLAILETLQRIDIYNK